jgi:hypothetical protein
VSDGLDRFRTAMARHLGQVMTPEVAAEIESYAFRYHDESVDPSRFQPHEYRGIVFAGRELPRDQGRVAPAAPDALLETERARDGQR